MKNKKTSKGRGLNKRARSGGERVGGWIRINMVKE